ncbi:MAG: EamA family transporter [Candidatus Woesearchaeota archaeon]
MRKKLEGREKTSQLKALLFVILCTFFTSAGQILYKMAASNLSANILLILGNVPLILGFISYFIGAALLITALRYGELSVVYPVISTGFVWVSILSSKLFGDVIGRWRLVGISLIILGVVLMGFGSSKNVSWRDRRLNLKVRRKC